MRNPDQTFLKPQLMARNPLAFALDLHKVDIFSIANPFLTLN